MSFDVNMARRVLTTRTAKLKTVVEENLARKSEDGINEALKLILSEMEWLQNTNKLLLDAYEARVIDEQKSRKPIDLVAVTSEVLEGGVSPLGYEMLSEMGLLLVGRS